MKPIDPNQAVNILNSLLELDANAITALIKNRVECNKQLVNSPISFCGKNEKGAVTGVLGMINSMFGKQASGRGYITASIDETGKIIRFFVENTDDDIPF